MALTQRGEVYAWGHHRVHQLGPVDNDRLLRNEDGAWYMPTPVRLTADRLFGQINAVPGAMRTSAGAGSAGALYNNGASSSSSSSSPPPPPPPPSSASESIEEEVVQVVAGWGHSALVTASGRVYMAGRNVQGQLGLGPVGCFPMNERGG